MIKFFRNARRKFLVENKFTRYLIYAVGETLLVVVGILIAIKINDWNRENVLKSSEIEIYEVIITDLKRDSVLFDTYESRYNLYLDTFFELNRIKNGSGEFKNFVPDFVVSNIEFNPVVQKNNLPILERLRDQDIRTKINSYFRYLNQVGQATEEFNALITVQSRPFFLEENNILNNDAVFNYEDRTFPPFLGVSVVDTVKLREAMNQEKFLPILSQLRMSMGFYLSVLEQGKKVNHELIRELEQASN
mgnify:CR=1 FL=1